MTNTTRQELSKSLAELAFILTNATQTVHIAQGHLLRRNDTALQSIHPTIQAAIDNANQYRTSLPPLFDMPRLDLPPAYPPGDEPYRTSVLRLLRLAKSTLLTCPRFQTNHHETDSIDLAREIEELIVKLDEDRK